ncbi:MAG TPA: hypothetical protein VE591_04550 [Candidatus Acidoferrum sp.]|nr:hypothetical protein [Candidatus Acidoferrum sp.]
MSPLLAYGQYYHPYAYHGGGATFGHGIMHMLTNALLYSAVSHMLGPLFHGHGIVGSILLGVAIIIAVALIRRVVAW